MDFEMLTVIYCIGKVILALHCLLVFVWWKEHRNNAIAESIKEAFETHKRKLRTFSTYVLSPFMADLTGSFKDELWDPWNWSHGWAIVILKIEF